MGIRRYGQSLNVFFSKLTFCHLSPFSTDPFNCTWSCTYLPVNNIVIMQVVVDPMLQ